MDSPFISNLIHAFNQSYVLLICISVANGAFRIRSLGAFTRAGKWKQGATVRDDGIRVASKAAFSESLKQEFADRSRTGFCNWLNLPENEEGFEEAVLQACRLLINLDQCIVRTPNMK